MIEEEEEEEARGGMLPSMVVGKTHLSVGGILVESKEREEDIKID